MSFREPRDRGPEPTRPHPLRVLVESYACGPGMGSEPGAGWNLPLHLATAGCDVTILATPRYRDAVDAEFDTCRQPGLRVVYVPEREWPMRMGWHLGSNLRYLLWLWEASTLAEALHQSSPFDVAHHVSYGSINHGSFLWRLGIPLVLGPAGGGQVAPPAFRRYFVHDWWSERVRTFAVRRLLVVNPFARQTCQRAALLLVSNAETREFARRLGARNIVVHSPDQGIPADFVPPTRPTRSGHQGLRLLWVGRVLERKALPLALDALAAIPGRAVHLDIVGSGTYAHQVPQWIEERGLSTAVTYHGGLEWSELKAFYRDSDALIFTSLRDSCGIQLLEAMAWGLPVIALDHQGTTYAVPEGAGLLVPVTTPGETCAALAGAIQQLAEHPELRDSMGEAGLEHAKGFTWDAIADRFIDSYKTLITDSSASHV